MKLCYKCKIIKEKTNFNKSEKEKDGLLSECKECRHQRYLLYFLKNKEKVLTKNKEWQKNNRDKYNVQRCKRYNKNLELSRQTVRQKRLNNLEHYRKYQREWFKRKRQENPRYAIEHRLRNRILIAMKKQNGKKAYKTTDLLGCEIDFFIKYIESLFTEGMNWEKLKNKEIEIDHILPCCQFNLLDENEQKKCFHYTNLQPIWKKDHIIKSKIDKKLTIKNEKAKEILNP